MRVHTKIVDGIPDFRPCIVKKSQMGWYYDDGRVIGALNEGVLNDRHTLVISEWFSRFPGYGHTKAALSWLRTQGFNTIVANSVGLIEDSVSDISVCYWQHMQALGLVDILLDDNGEDITDVKPHCCAWQPLQVCSLMAVQRTRLKAP